MRIIVPRDTRCGTSYSAYYGACTHHTCEGEHNPRMDALPLTCTVSIWFGYRGCANLYDTTCQCMRGIQRYVTYRKMEVAPHTIFHHRTPRRNVPVRRSRLARPKGVRSLMTFAWGQVMTTHCSPHLLLIPPVHLPLLLDKQRHTGSDDPPLSIGRGQDEGQTISARVGRGLHLYSQGAPS